MTDSTRRTCIAVLLMAALWGHVEQAARAQMSQRAPNRLFGGESAAAGTSSDRCMSANKDARRSRSTECVQSDNAAPDAGAVSQVGANQALRCAPLKRFLFASGDSSAAFSGAAVTAAGDIWAVGSGMRGLAGRAFAAHWHGNRWKALNILSGPRAPYLAGIAAASSQSIWAVGGYNSSLRQELIEHWNGKTWRSVASPTVASSELSGVVALGANDVWAVGRGYPTPTALQPLVEHWDGRRWRLAPISGVPGYGVLNAVSASSPHDVWAVGERLDDYGTALVAHYDGRRWRAMDGLSDPRIQTDLSAVAAISPSDVWAAGNVGDGVTPYHKIIEHWDGRQWKFIKDIPFVSDTLTGIAASSANDVWAGGAGLLERWDGKRWRQLALPSGDFVGTVVMAGSGVAWVAGSSLRYTRGVTTVEPLIEKFDMVRCAAARGGVPK